MPRLSTSLALLLTVTLAASGCARGCRKSRTTVLHLIPPDAALVAWSPSPEQALADLDGFLATFERESLGDQLKALRFELAHQLGFEAFDPRALRALGLDPAQPWAAVFAGELTTPPVWLLAANDPGAVLSRLRVLAKEAAGADRERVLGRGDDRVVVLAQPFGDALLDVIAIRLAPHAVLVATGDGAADRLSSWPSAEALTKREGPFKSFGQQWKKAESDGSAAGAAVRMVARSGLEVAGLRVAEIFGEDAELRLALTMRQHRLDFFVSFLGLSQKALARLARDSRKPTQRAPGAGLPAKAFVLARSELQPAALLAFARALSPLRPLLDLLDGQVGAGRLDEALPLLTGECELAVELKSSFSPSPRPQSPNERLAALLDLFPITAVAQLTEPAAFDALLPKVEHALGARGINATLHTEAGMPVLRAGHGSQAALSRRNSTLVYGIGPGAFARALERLAKGQGPNQDAPLVASLLVPGTSGVVVDLAALRPLLGQLPGVLFGEDNAIVRTLVGRTLKSFEHFTSAGLTLAFEGPAVGAHPVLRAWIETE